MVEANRPEPSHPGATADDPPDDEIVPDHERPFREPQPLATG